MLVKNWKVDSWKVAGCWLLVDGNWKPE